MSKKRYKMRGRSSRRLFTRTAKRVNYRNAPAPVAFRGGIRL